MTPDISFLPIRSNINQDTLYQIPLIHASVNPDPSIQSYKQHCFEVVIKNTDESVSTYLFSASSKHQKEEWVELLLQQIYQGGTKKLNGSGRRNTKKHTDSPRKELTSQQSEPLVGIIEIL